MLEKIINYEIHCTGTLLAILFHPIEDTVYEESNILLHHHRCRHCQPQAYHSTLADRKGNLSFTYTSLQSVC